MHIFHKWGKWEETARGNVTDIFSGQRLVIGQYIQQVRECSVCGKKQIVQSQS